jgi:flagellar hook-associated protein 2
MGTRIGAITFGGLSSGLPTDEIIGQLLELSRRPIDVLQQRRDDFTARLEIYQDLNGKATSLRDLLRDLDNMANVVRNFGEDPSPSATEEFRSFQATSSDRARATASVGDNAVAGNLTFSIESLATQHREVSTAYDAATDVVAAAGGTLTITVDGTDTDVVLPSGASVQDLVDAVNGSGADVSAFVLDTGEATGNIRAVLVSNQPGTSQQISLSNDFGETFTTSQQGGDAQIILDPAGPLPLKIFSSSNTFENVIQGATIYVLEAAPGETVTITIDTSVDDIVDRISQLVSNFNEIAGVVNEQNRVDPTTNRGGPLLGDSALTSLSQRLAGSIARSYGTGDITTTAQVGIQLGRDGLLSLDEDKLRNALESGFEDAASFLTGTGSFTDSLREVLDSFVDPVDGGLVARINGTTASIADVDDSIEAAEDRLTSLEDNLVRQFTALERTVSQFQQQANFLASFLLAGSQQ